MNLSQQEFPQFLRGSCLSQVTPTLVPTLVSRSDTSYTLTDTSDTLIGQVHPVHDKQIQIWGEVHKLMSPTDKQRGVVDRHNAQIHSGCSNVPLLFFGIQTANRGVPRKLTPNIGLDPM